MRLSLAFIFILLLSFLSCKKKLNVSKVPKITYNGMNPQRIELGPNLSTVRVSFTLEDGDGNISFNRNNLFFKDLRNDSILALPLPEVPSDYSPSTGVKGLVEVTYLSNWLALRADTTHLHNDTLQWEIFMVDEDSNYSNTILSDTLYLSKK